MNIMEGEEENGWIVVRHKKRKHIGKEVKPEKVFTKGGNAGYDREVNLNLQEEFITHPFTLMNSKTVSTFLQGLKCPRVEVHCLGIGSFSSLLKPQIQMLFLRHCLIEQLKEMSKEYSLNIFDPIFSQQQREEVRQMGGSCLQFTKMEQGRAYIMYMPHCDRFLYERLCQLKKSHPTCQTIVIGNSINEYKDLCLITAQPIPESLQPFSPKETKMKDFKQAFNDTFIYALEP